MVGLYRRAINDRPYYIIDTLFDKRQFVGAKDPPGDKMKKLPPE